ncbi:MAG: pitrilysin family protein [Armatimonadota bacterium]
MTSESSISKTVLNNGIRVLTEKVGYVESVSIGIWVVVGSRDEDAKSNGISHFCEHLFFKGTEKRSAAQIADEMDCMGAHLNAFTDKEFTCFYVKALREYIHQAMDIMSDMILNSVFDKTEIEREKNVVIEEIKRHDDTPEDQVHDIVAQTLWKDHPLGRSVIGTTDVISNINRETIVNYINRYYRPNSIVIAAAGNLEHQEIVDLVSKYFSNLSGKRPEREPIKIQLNPEKKIIKKSTEQVHFCMSANGCSQHDKRKYSLAAIDAILGGSMSSRLFQEIREKRGLVYSIGSYASSYNEAGMFVIYGGTGPKSYPTVMELTREEISKLGKYGISDSELLRAKNQIRGALVMGQESMSNRMSRLAKSELYFDRIIRLDDILTEIENVSRDDVAYLAKDLTNSDGFAEVAIGPFK